MKSMTPCAAKNWDRIKLRLGYECAEPGCNCTENLQLDHKNPLTKKFDVKSRLSCKWVNLIDEVDKCQFLCEKHHDKKTRNEDWEVIQYKRKECIWLDFSYNPLLDEHQMHFTLDIHKKTGKKLYKILCKISEDQNCSFNDAVEKLMDMTFNEDNLSKLKRAKRGEKNEFSHLFNGGKK